jgi:hypothetical protein
MVGAVDTAAVDEASGCPPILAIAEQSLGIYRQAATAWLACNPLPYPEGFDACIADEVEPLLAEAHKLKTDAVLALALLPREPGATARPIATPPPRTPAPTATATPAPPVVKSDEHIAVIDSGSYRFARQFLYGAVIENTNEPGLVANVHVTVDIRNESGARVASRTTDLILFSGERAAVGDEVNVSDGRTMDITVEAEWDEVDFEPGAFQVRNVELKQSLTASVVTGRITCNFVEDPENVTVVGIFRDGTGRILGGAWDYVTVLDCAGEEVTIRAAQILPDVVSAELYPNF